MIRNCRAWGVLVCVALAAWGLGLGGGAAACAHRVAPAAGEKIALPPPGKLYLGVYPGGKTGEEDDITAADVTSYQHTVGQQVAWVYFSDNWYRSREFPVATCTWIRQLGSVPFIRLMLRSSSKEVTEQGQKQQQRAAGEAPAPVLASPPVVEPVFTLPAIIDGEFDADLRAWARAAQAFGTPVIVEWGTECNGDWFQWNGKYWGAGHLTDFGDATRADGPERFVAAYRHIVMVMREAGANNLTWVFHVNWDDEPDEDWNHFENYYPGDDVVDWLGVSCYGYLTPKDNYDPESLEMEMNAAYPRLAALAPDKPIMLLEFGATAGNPGTVPEDWAQAALDHLLAPRWPRVRGFSWWNERWENDDDPGDGTTMRVQDLPELATVFHDTLAAHRAQLQTRPVYGR